jgi:hypothetical protein
LFDLLGNRHNVFVSELMRFVSGIRFVSWSVITYYQIPPKRDFILSSSKSAS